MIKVRIGNGMDLTLLALAFTKSQLPKAKSGEVFYDHNEKNEIDSLYFSNEEYYQKLLEFIENNRSNFSDSNAPSEWNSLFSTLNNYKKIQEESLDFGRLDHYTLAENNFEQRELNLDILNNVSKRNSSFYEDVKRLYKGYDVSYWGSPDFVVIKYEFDHEIEFNFDLKPIVQLVNEHNKKLKAFNIYRDPRRGLNTIRIGIE
ncbi:hypothetical protein [Salegentibacter flavus]|uniref:Uncharacterized protein n=1 Tax=Salegentibacter flavus TaxID=287099 RepID=A0A1I5DF01_9FLAO|nr:hypothetical protein [Salegentibacter flavus]SFN97825.1 hypothetical protein SAMN05660413_03310 [Salegentibacter flavus]